jgi:hypothetical protein
LRGRDGNDIPLAVHDADVGRAGLIGRHRLRGPQRAAADPHRFLYRAFFRKQFCDGNLDHIRVTQRATAILPAELRRLRKQVKVLSAPRRHPRDIESLQCFEDLEHRQPAGRWRWRVDIESAVFHADRLDRPRVIVGKVALRNDSAVRLQMADDGPGDVPLVKDLRPLVCNAAQQPAERFLNPQLARARNVPIGEQGRA